MFPFSEMLIHLHAKNTKNSKELNSNVELKPTENIISNMVFI